MIIIKSVGNFIKGLLPFVFRKSKSIIALINGVLSSVLGDIVQGQDYTQRLLAEGKYKGQMQVVNERIKEVFEDKNIEVRDGSDGNVVIIGRKKPYVRIMGLEKETAFIAISMERTTVGIDFIVEIPKASGVNEEDVKQWLDAIVMAGVGFKIRRV